MDGIKAKALVDSGSMIKSVAVEFYNALPAVGIVKANTHCTLQPYESRTVGIIRKREHLSAAVTEVCESGHCSNRVTVCPRVVALDNVGKNARVPVRIFNMYARLITIRRKASICELHKVTVLRSAEFTKASEETDLDSEVHINNTLVLKSQYIKQLLVRNKGLGLFVPKERTIVRN